MNHCGTQRLDTERLVLRKYVYEDAAAMYKNWASDKEVTKYLTWPAHSSQEVTQGVIKDWMNIPTRAIITGRLCSKTMGMNRSETGKAAHSGAVCDAPYLRVGFKFMIDKWKILHYNSFHTISIGNI